MTTPAAFQKTLDKREATTRIFAGCPLAKMKSAILDAGGYKIPYLTEMRRDELINHMADNWTRASILEFRGQLETV